MKTTHLLFVAALCLFPSCKDGDNDRKIEEARLAAEASIDDPEAAAEKAAELQNEISSILDTVKDSDSANKALENLKPVIAQFAAFLKATPKDESQVSPTLKKKADAIIAIPQARMAKALQKALPIFKKDPELSQKFDTLIESLDQ